MKYLIFFCALLSLPIYQATDLFFISNKNEVPGVNSFYQIKNIDTDCPQSSILNSRLDASRNYLSDSCICNGNYFAIWNDISSYDWSITKISLKDYTNTEIPKTKHFMHSLSCGNTSTTLLGVGNIPQKNLQFNIVTIDIETGEENVLLTLDNKEGNLFDTQFSYIPSLDQYWIVLLEEKRFGSIKNTFYQIDMKTMNVNTMDITLSKNTMVYYTTRVDNQNLIFFLDVETFKLYASTFEINGQSIEIQKEKLKEVDDLNTFGINIPVDEKNLIYFINSDQNLISITDHDLKMKRKYSYDDFNIPNLLIGGVCVKN
jgi:hypothetical protein